LNLIVLIIYRQFLLRQPKIRSIFAPPTEKPLPRLCTVVNSVSRLRDKTSAKSKLD